LVVEILGVWAVRAQDHLHSFIKISDAFPESVQVKVVSHIIFVYLNEKFMAFKITKPLDPT